MDTKNQHNLAACMHLATFLGFVLPFGNLLGPLFLWITNKDKSTFLYAHGKQAINFQLSIFLYSLCIVLLTLPILFFCILNGFSFFHTNHLLIDWQSFSPFIVIGGSITFLFIIGFIIEFALIIQASLAAKEGKAYQYPLTISFIK